MSRILVIPDLQVRANVSLGHLPCIGKYVVDTKPDYIVQIGDFADCYALNSHTSKYEQERVRLVDDVNAVRLAQELLLQPIKEYNDGQRKLKKRQYKPEMFITLGNHEDRLTRFFNERPEFIGMFPEDLFQFGENGWTVLPFKEVLEIDGVFFSHFFQTTSAGNPSSTARALLNRRLSSCIQGHKQGLDWAHSYRPDGSKISCIIAGSAYNHSEPYMGQQDKTHWRGLVLLDNVKDGDFYESFIPLEWIKQKYGYKPEEDVCYAGNNYIVDINNP